MKFIFNIIVFLNILLIGGGLGAKNFAASYKVTTKGVKIGSLTWNLTKNTESYSLKIDLNSKGFFSPLYKFQGTYFSEGYIKNDVFITNLYSQKWLTKKKKRNVKMVFKENLIHSLNQTPEEKEWPRVNFTELKDYSDPLTSFLKLLSGIDKSKTIDGRRIYVFSLSDISEDLHKKTYVIKNFVNIWADHKRNDLEQISIISKSNKNIPDSIFIKFKGQLIKVIKD